VAKLTFVCLLISFLAIHHSLLHQLDIKNVFLHGILDEETYIEQPLGFVTQRESRQVCRLWKSLLSSSNLIEHGLGNLPHLLFGFPRSHKDHFVFFRLYQGK